MTIQEINKAYRRITGLLDNRELKDALGLLQGLIAATQAYTCQDTLLHLRETYTYMLRYRLEGANDPMQDDIYHSLLSSAYELAGRIRHQALYGISSNLYYNKRRTFHLFPPNSYANLRAKLEVGVCNAEDKQLFESGLTALFHRLWVSDPLTPDEVSAIKEILYDDKLHHAAGCQIVAALWLGLQMSFDKEKLFLLFDALSLDEEEIRVRALVSILLTLYIYRHRVSLYPQIKDRLEAQCEVNPKFTKEIRAVILRFILSRETEKITRKLQEEIIPEMIKLGPKINLKDQAADATGDEINPEWQDMISNSSLGKKMEEFSELQQEGADVMHSTFIHLKNFPFFRDLSNWFLPFIPEYFLSGDSFSGQKEKEILETLSSASFLCNSDKYSLCFSMMNLPERHRQAMISQFSGQATEMIEQHKAKLISKRGKPEIIIGQYIQDLYRFYKLCPAKADFEDIFSLHLDFHNLEILKPYISDEESLTVIAEYYMHKNYFSDALPLFETLTRNNPDGILFQKIGYCLEMNGRTDEAIKAYLRADLLNPDSKWLVKRMAGCFRALKKPMEALKYYKRLEKLEKENLSVQLSIGYCLLELKEYNEALKYLFKIDYLDTKRNKAWRPIAWISFITGKYDQAQKYYRNIIESQPNMQDYMNAGHTEWAMQNLKGALEFYKRSVETEGDFHKFLEQFNRDIPELTHAGIEKNEIALMLDQLRYSLEEE